MGQPIVVEIGHFEEVEEDLEILKVFCPSIVSVLSLLSNVITLNTGWLKHDFLNLENFPKTCFIILCHFIAEHT